MWQGQEYYHRKQAMEHHQQVGREVLTARAEQAAMMKQLGKVLQWLDNSFATWRQSAQTPKLGMKLARKLK